MCQALCQVMRLSPHGPPRPRQLTAFCEPRLKGGNEQISTLLVFSFNTSLFTKKKLNRDYRPGLLESDLSSKYKFSVAELG